MNGSGVNIKKFGFNKNFPKKFTVLMISRIIKDKGIDTFFEAVEILRKKCRFKFCVLWAITKSVDNYNISHLKKNKTIRH